MVAEAVEAFSIPENATIIEALAVIDRAGGGICCLLSDTGVLAGVFTDGDARRALLGGAGLDARAIDFATRSPRVVRDRSQRAHVLDLMKSSRLSAIPEIDEVGRVVAMHTLSEIIGAKRLPNRAVIMAGGKGTRLGALTRSTPKPLMTVAGRPIIEWVILGLVGNGITRISISVNHMADQIVDRLGDGSALGCSIDYLRESPDNPLGTAGSLQFLDDAEKADDAPPVIVVNSDLMVEFDASALVDAHRASGASMTLGTKSYSHSVPYGVIEADADRRVTAMVEKPDLTVEVNAAVYCIDAALIREVPKGEPSTMPGLAQLCLDRGDLVRSWPIDAEWIDVGTPQDLARAKGEV